jgi:biopolymer transport protein ExbD
MRVERSVGGHDQDHHGVDLAPMLDFVVNLLIFFIVTAIFVKESGLAVRRPASGADDASRPVPSIVILASGDIVIDGRTVDQRAVRANVERIRAADPNTGLVIVAESHAPLGTLVGVVDQVHLGGIDDITFSTTE